MKLQYGTNLYQINNYIQAWSTSQYIVIFKVKSNHQVTALKPTLLKNAAKNEAGKHQGILGRQYLQKLRAYLSSIR